MRVKHNKKRNSGIVFSQLTEYISQSLVEGKSSKAKKALSILKKHFNKNSEIFKEYKIFKVLLNSSLESRQEALDVIDETSKRASRINQDVLRREKSALIRDINYNLDEANFYDRRISDYRTLATIQTLLTNWCSESSELDLETSLSFKSYLVEHLTKKKEAGQKLQELKTPDANSLTLNLMKEKFENKFSKELSNEQVEILRAYAFSSSDSNVSEVCTKIKRTLLENLSEFKLSCDNDTLLSKIEVVQEKISELNTESLNDDQVSKYLTLTQLSSEICEG